MAHRPQYVTNTVTEKIGDSTLKVTLENANFFVTVRMSNNTAQKLIQEMQSKMALGGNNNGERKADT